MTTNPPAGRDVREDLLRAIDVPYANGLGYETPEMLVAAYRDVVLAAVPPPAPRAVDRAAVLREVADRIDAEDLPQDVVDIFDNGARWATTLLRRMADEAQPAKPDPCPHGCDTSTCPCLACEAEEAQQQPEPAVVPPPALTEEGRLRAQVQVLQQDAERDRGLAKVGARCMREGHQGLIEGGRLVLEGWRFALSTALDLGTDAPWEAIHARVKELAAADGAGGARRAADDEPADETPCSDPPCETGPGEPCDRHETEQAHADGLHEDCGVTCEVQFPTEHLRNFILAKGYPGTAGMLDELLRRAAVGERQPGPDLADWSSPEDAVYDQPSAAEAQPTARPECAHCWREIENRGTPSMGDPGHDRWVHVPGGFEPCFPQRGADSPRAEPRAAEDAPRREPHPTEADMRHALAVFARFHGQDTATPATETQQDGAQSTPDLCSLCEHNWHGTGRCDGGSVSTITGCRCAGAR